MGLQDLRYQTEFRDREAMLRHLKSFKLDIKPCIGMWYLSGGGSRFHETYGEVRNIEQCIEMVEELAEYGVRAVEGHYGEEFNEENLCLYQKLQEKTGIRISGMGPHTFYDRQFMFGTLSNPIGEIRDRATKKLIDVLKLVKSADADGCGLWPGIDGYTYPYGHPFYQMWENFEGALADAMDEVPGVMVRLEPKPYEPVPNNIYRTTADALLLAHDIEARLKNPLNRKLLDEGVRLVGMQPEIGHIRMGYEDVPYAFSRICREGRMSHPHFNSQPLGNYDQDLNIGVVEWDQAEAGLLALKMAGFKEYIGIDINPERMPPRIAVKNNIRALQIMNERIERLDYQRLLNCYYDPEQNQGELEMILVENMR